MTKGTLIVRKKKDTQQEMMQTIREMLGTINCGSLTLVIQDGKVLQMDRKVNIRLQP